MHPEHEDAVAYVDADAYYVVPERIFLVESRFADRSGPAAEPDPLPEDSGFLVSMGLHRLSRLTLTVALSVSYGGEDVPFDLYITYAGQFRMRDTVPADAVEPLWGYIARDLAVKLLYPYIRQAVSEMTEKWRGDKVFLPFLPLPLEFADQENFAVPLPTDDGQVSLLDGLEVG